MTIIVAAKSCLLSQHSLLYTKTKFPIISNSVNPSYKLLQNPSSCNNNSSLISRSLSHTTRRRRTRHSSFLTFAVDESGNSDPYENLGFFVGNLHGDGIEIEVVLNLFKKIGTVVGIVIYYGESYRQSSYARVIMKTVEEVEKTLNKFGDYYLNGKLLTVSREKPIIGVVDDFDSRPFLRAYGSRFGIRVENLSKDVYCGRLEESFSKHGKVESVEILYNVIEYFDDERIDSSPIGYLIMANATDRNNAIAALNNQSLDGEVTKLSVSKVCT